MPVAYLCLCLQVLVMVCRSVSSGDVFTSSAHLRMLHAGERELINAVKSYISDTREKMEQLEKLIAEVEDNRMSIWDSHMPASHPIDAMWLIKRFTTTWNGDIFPLVSDAAAAKGVDNLRQSMKDIIPTEEDYDGAKSSLLRLQYTYLLPVSDLINGTIMGQRTKPLSQQMAVEVSMYAFRRMLTDDALVWLAHSKNHLVPPLVPLQDIYHAFGRIYAQKGELLLASKFITKALELDPSNARFLSEIMPDPASSEPVWSLMDSRQDKFCREHAIENRTVRRSNKEDICRLERGRVVPFTYSKVEYLNQSPDVLIFHDFISDGEAKRLIDLGKAKMKRALIGDEHEHFKSEHRIAKISWLFDNSDEPVVDKITRRIGEFTDLEVKGFLSAEPLQLGNYGIGGYYALHQDYTLVRSETDNITDEMIRGDRIATLMIYLSNVEAGGATIFPEIDLGTRPIKNAAVFWYNYKRSGQQEPKMLHAGCPVLIGEKWVANKWIREFNQLFKRPCDLKMDV